MPVLFLVVSTLLLRRVKTGCCRDHGDRRQGDAKLLAPVHAAPARRRNFFRGAMLIESARVASCGEAAPMLAACAEVGWTCALILDDIADRSEEREGAPSIHRSHALMHVVTAVACTLMLVARTLAVHIPAPLRTRLCWLHLGISLVLRAARGAFGTRPRTLHQYARTARRVNASIEWSLLAPFCGSTRIELRRALRGYARHSSVAGKMRNDLLDYWGGSSERDAMLADFNRTRLTFPTLVLLACPLAAADRVRVADHFASRRRLPAQEL